MEENKKWYELVESISNINNRINNGESKESIYTSMGFNNLTYLVNFFNNK